MCQFIFGDPLRYDMLTFFQWWGCSLTSGHLQRNAFGASVTKAVKGASWEVSQARKQWMVDDGWMVNGDLPISIYKICRKRNYRCHSAHGHGEAQRNDQGTWVHRDQWKVELTIFQTRNKGLRMMETPIRPGYVHISEPGDQIFYDFLISFVLFTIFLLVPNFCPLPFAKLHNARHVIWIGDSKL